MRRSAAANFHYNLVDGADDQFLRDRPMVRARDDDLPSVRRKTDELRLYFVSPDLLIRCCLSVQSGISEVERLTGRQDN